MSDVRRLATAAAAALAVLALTAGPAWADTGIGGGTGSTGGPVGPAEPGPGRTPPGGGGGTYDPSPTPPGAVWHTAHDTWDADAHQTSGSYWWGSISCPQQADGRWSLGVTWSYYTWVDATGSDTRHGTVSRECAYDPPPVTVVRDCTWTATVTAVGPALNPAVTSARVINATAASAFYRSRDLADCDRANFVYDSTQVTALGRYQLTAAAYNVRCTTRVYRSQAPMLVGCGAPYEVAAGADTLELRCDGYTRGRWTVDDYTETPCEGAGGPGAWSCGPRPYPTVDGAPGGAVVTLPGSGSGHRVTWGPVRPVGVTGARILATTLTVADGSTPAWPHHPDSVQPYRLSTDGVSPGEVRSLTARWYKASDVGKPWVLGRSVLVEGTFSHPVPVITGVSSTGHVLVRAGSATSTGQGRCDSRALTVNAVRARGVN